MADHKIDGNDGAGNVQAPDRIWLTTTESGKVDDWTQWLDDQEQLHPEAPRTEYIRADVAEAELATMTAEREELASAIDSIEASHGLTDNGNLWRFWAKTAREIAAKNTALAAERDAANARADQAEYRIVHIAAGLFPGGFDNNVAAIRDALRDKPAPAVTVQVAKEALMVESIDSVSKTCKLFGLSEPHFRAALRAIAGGGDE